MVHGGSGGVFHPPHVNRMNKPCANPIHSVLALRLRLRRRQCGPGLGVRNQGCVPESAFVSLLILRLSHPSDCNRFEAETAFPYDRCACPSGALLK